MYDDLIYFVPPGNSFTGPAQLQMARYDDEILGRVVCERKRRHPVRIRADLPLQPNSRWGTPRV